MLCRVLFVAAVVSYVLCVLLLSGVQKEELDAGMLRKLQRHNVNIDAIGDRKLRSQCLMEKDLATTLPTVGVNLDNETKKSTMKPITFELDTQVGDSPAQWNKLFDYLKQQKYQNASQLKETTTQSSILQSDSKINALLSRFMEDSNNKVTKIPDITVKSNKKEQAGYILNNSDKSHPKSSTANDNTINERSNDVEYISKIVAELLSQRQPKAVQRSTVLPIRTFTANKLVEDLDELLEENKKSDAPFHNNYRLNTTVIEKQESSNENTGHKKERQNMEGFLNQLKNPISNIRNSFINNVQTELKEGKVTLFNARDKLSDMLSITKNEPNNWLYVVDSQSIKPIDSEPSADQKVEVFNQLSERDKSNLCKSNNGIYLIQKETYKYICPYDQRTSELTEATPEEQINLHINKQSSKYVSENDHYSNEYNSNWPYFIENQNSKKYQKLEAERNNLDMQLPSERYKPTKTDERRVDDGYKNKLQYFLERQRSREQEKQYRGNPNLLFNRPNNREQSINVKSEADRAKVANNQHSGSYYKTEWDFNVQNTKELQPKLESEYENLTFIRPHAGENVSIPEYPSFNREFKNTWSYYLDDIRITQKPNMQDKNGLYQIPPDREILINNQEQMSLEKESSINNRHRHRSDPKSLNWNEMERNDMNDTKSIGTLGYKTKVQQQSLILGETKNAKNNISPGNYETINWPYFIDRQKAQLDLFATDGNKKEPLYINDAKILKHKNYEYDTQKERTYNKLLMNAEARSNLYQQYTVTEKSKNGIQKEDNEKVKSLPPDILKEIADTVKEIVLKDLKTGTPVTSFKTATITTTTAIPIIITTMASTTTTIPTTTTTSSTVTTTQIPITIVANELKTTTDTPPKPVTEDHINFQEASQALKNFMELFEKFNLMKNGNQNPKVTQYRDIITHTQRAVVIAKPTPIAPIPYAPNEITTPPTMVRSPFASYKFYAPLIPPMSPYGNIKPPYLHTKAMVLDPYLQKIIQVPTTIHNNPLDNIHTASRSAQALTFQTNSNEIKPLNIPVSKGMIVDNIVLSPKPPRDRERNLREYSDETYRYRKPYRYNQINEYKTRSNRSRDYFRYDERPKPRSMKKEYSHNDRSYKPRSNYEGVRFHEKLEKENNWPRSSMEGKCGSKEDCNDRVVPRQQRPLINIASTYDDSHFRNFLKTQQKVNDMLERILATKTKHRPSDDTLDNKHFENYFRREGDDRRRDSTIRKKIMVRINNGRCYVRP